MFFPPLDSTVVVDVPSNTRAGGVTLLFRARTGSASALERFKRDGVKVQAWTNAPVVNGSAEGKWAAYDFEEAQAATPVKLDDSITHFTLPPPTEDNVVDELHTFFLTLRLRPLPQDQSEADFQVTYRLLYPNGKIKWLGYPGRDLRCVLKKTDPWLGSPVLADQRSGDVYRTFSSVTMKEPWGCWAVGPRSVKYYPKGRATDCEASFLVFVPRRTPSMFALHQPIILHGAGLRLDSTGVVTCRTSPPTRVYTAITSETELSFAVPDLGLRWFGVKEGYAFITSAAPEQPVSIHAVPLFVGPAAAEHPTTVSLDLASQGLLAGHPRFVVYSPLSQEVLGSGDLGSRQLHLSVGRSGGSCVVSPVYTLSANKPLPIGKAPWTIAYVTPHVVLATELDKAGDSATEASKPECDSETEFLSREIKPHAPPPCSRPLVVTAISLNPRRTIAFLIPLLWRTLGLLLRALVMRLLATVGLPVSPLVSYLRPAHPKGETIETHARALVIESKTGSSGLSKVGNAASKKGERPVEAISDSTTEGASSAVGKRWRPWRTFQVPNGPFSLLAHAELGTETDGDEKTRSPFPEVVVDGECLDLKTTALSHGWTIMQTTGDVSGGKVEIYGMAASISSESESRH
ncbi:hypothetical protein F5148DRAFT_1168891 [Russula earlei]|uniref:Uncharacterized protein n=1 Tax=Russula earlei TaxID=71964 RepID=A0ACC0UKQ3_9AGAM|nr:hypothetical protein F5148DRAFT_1168891 [Russula earlei]